MEIIVRPGTHEDLPFMHKMLYEAVIWRPDAARPNIDDVLSRPEIARILEDWGRDGDTSLIAETLSAKPVGAAWYRFWYDENHSYGYVSAEIPEIGMAVAQGMRRRGIGDKLLNDLKKLAADRGIEHLSLSVEKGNRATQLYMKHDFEQVSMVNNAVTMVARTYPKK